MSLLNTLQLWRDIEMFQAFDLDEVLVVEDDSWHVSLNEPPCHFPPWLAPVNWGLNPEYNYAFDLFLGIFEKEESHNVVRNLYSKEDFLESFDDSREPEGTTCVARLGISALGESLIEDCRISTLPWALTTVSQGHELSLDGFDSYGRDLLMRIASCRTPRATLSVSDCDSDSEEVFAPLSWDAIRAINIEVRRGIDVAWRDFSNRVVIVAHRLGKKKPTDCADNSRPQPASNAPLHPEPLPPTSASDIKTSGAKQPRLKRRCEILNSFYLRDLQRVAQRIGNINQRAPLYSYLNAAPHTARIDVAKPSGELWSRVALQSVPLGCWPNDPQRFNSLMQQLAVNEYTSGKHSLFSVNGPPGTGKTTLVKDIVASAVVQRALKLVRYRSADDAFEKLSVSCEVDRSRYVIKKLKRDLLGFEVLIASSNNNAVENITRELPKRSGIADIFSHAAYLPEVATLYEDIRSGSDPFNQESQSDNRWGLISIPLGNRRNREIFCDALLYGPREEKDSKARRQKEATRLTLHEWRKQIPPSGTISYAKARLEFLDAHKKVEELLHKILHTTEDSKDAILQDNEHFLKPNNSDFDSLSVQARAPWLTERINQARAMLFIAALGLHQAWVREATGLGANLSAVGKLLSRPDAFEEEIAAHIWQSLFMVVPAISTTLASVERMCAAVGEGAFGHIIIEEAGQATPQSVAGILWRAKRALVIGDPMQIQPVVSVPEVLVRHFCKSHKVSNPLFSPLASSAQALADESNELGTYLEHSVANTWVGTPLRVHRRCLEPMFSIANTIAYGGLMTFGTADSSATVDYLSALPTSAWFDVPGACSGRHWVPQHGEAACKLLERVLSSAYGQEPEIFFITPFRSIRERLRNILGDHARALGCSKERVAAIRRRVGTVHTFQGKEANVVTFVLGCDDSTRGAARWAGEKPNLLNVAVTRARHRLYVIGDLSLWHNQGFFSELANSLPRSLF
jgi:hypothetical protein